MGEKLKICFTNSTCTQFVILGNGKVLAQVQKVYSKAMYGVRNEQKCFTNSTCTQFGVAFAVEKNSPRYKKYTAKLSNLWVRNEQKCFTNSPRTQFVAIASLGNGKILAQVQKVCVKANFMCAL